jgi:hypothetical protein
VISLIVANHLAILVTLRYTSNSTWKSAILSAIGQAVKKRSSLGSTWNITKVITAKTVRLCALFKIADSLSKIPHRYRATPTHIQMTANINAISQTAVNGLLGPIS